MPQLNRIFHQRFASPGAVSTVTTNSIPLASWVKKSIYVVAEDAGTSDDVTVEIQYSTSIVGSGRYQPDGLVLSPTSDFYPVSGQTAITLAPDEVFVYSTEDMVPWGRVEITTGATAPSNIDVWVIVGKED